MENRTVWQEVMGYAPEGNDHLDYLFHESIGRRFPDLKLPAAELSRYVAHSL